MKAHYARLGVLLALLLTGCASKPSLVGTWTGALPLGATTVEMEFGFGSDGKLSVKQSVSGQSSTQFGAYGAEEKSFTFSPTSIESPSLTPEQNKQLSDQLATSKKQVVFTLEWKDSNTISILQQGAPAPRNQAIVLKRTKG